MKLSQQCIKEEVDMSQLSVSLYIYIYMIDNSIYIYITYCATTNKCAKNGFVIE